MSLEQLAQIYSSYQGQVSLKGFMRLVDQPYWRLRDYLRSEAARAQRQQALAQAAEQVKAIATEESSYGYRRVYRRLLDKGIKMGREAVRRLMRDLGLQAVPIRKRRREKCEVTHPTDWPVGRRIQIDATRLSLDDGVAWVYLVEDVQSRQCLAISAEAKLNQVRAAETLLAGYYQLTALGFEGPCVVQSDAGSDFTSLYFQRVCRQIGHWVRCRVSQIGGMGILERLNRTFKHEFIFRHEVNTLEQLNALLPQFLKWYNQRRLHSSLGYRTPADVLGEQVIPIPS